MTSAIQIENVKLQVHSFTKFPNSQYKWKIKDIQYGCCFLAIQVQSTDLCIQQNLMPSHFIQDLQRGYLSDCKLMQGVA